MGSSTSLPCRRILALLVLWTVALLGNRALGWARAVPVPDVLFTDLLLAAAIPGAAVVLGYRNLLVGALLCAIGAVAALLWPSHLALSYPLAIVGSQISYLLVGLWQDRAVEAPEPGAP